MERKKTQFSQLKSEREEQSQKTDNSSRITKNYSKQESVISAKEQIDQWNVIKSPETDLQKCRS